MFERASPDLHSMEAEYSTEQLDNAWDNDLSGQILTHSLGVNGVALFLDAALAECRILHRDEGVRVSYAEHLKDFASFGRRRSHKFLPDPHEESSCLLTRLDHVLPQDVLRVCLETQAPRELSAEIHDLC